MQTLRGLGTVRLAAMGAVALALVVFFVFLSQRLSAPDYALLFGNLEPSESTKIVGKLEAMNVPYQLRAGGRQILVPQDRVLKLRMSMAQNGLPSDGTVGYELFDKSDMLGTTSFVQRINLVRALEGELERTIGSINSVARARVHLVIPRRALFSREERHPTASVLITPKGADQLTKGQVAAIQHLVASSVAGLDPSRVSVIDSSGHLLARGDGSSEGAGAIDSNEDLRRAYEDRMSRMIEELLEQSVGVGKVRAEVTANMDFDRVTTNTEKYDPDGQVVRSTQTVEQKNASTDTRNRNSVSVKNNLPSGQTPNASSGNRSQDQSSRDEETVNYEISKTVQNHVREAGTVRRLSVAVLVDGTYSRGKNGKLVYHPRSKEEMTQLTKLVQSAIGYDAKRGDKLELINLRFAAGPQEPPKIVPPLFGLTKADYFRIAELLVLAVVAILVLLLVVRPLVNRTLDALPTALSRDHEAKLLANQSVDSPALTGPSATGVDEAQEEEMIDVAQIDGRVRASTIKKIGEIVEHHPEETVSIIREWLFQEA